jgi:hypothetical protein
MEVNLSREKFNLKKYAQFGMISFSEHAKERMRERSFTPIMIFEYLTERNSTIVQYKEPGTYNNNYPRFVMYGKIDRKPVHIVIDKITKNSVTKYEVVTVYEPSKKYFSHNGRYVKKAIARK